MTRCPWPTFHCPVSLSYFCVDPSIKVCFSAAKTSASFKTCIVSVLNLLSSALYDPVPSTHIFCSSDFVIIMLPTTKELTGHIAFGSSVPACVPPWFHSSRFLMHNISYEPCMLGFWNLIYGFLITFFFSCSYYFPFWSYAPLKIRMKSCQQDISNIIQARGLNLG